MSFGGGFGNTFASPIGASNNFNQGFGRPAGNSPQTSWNKPATGQFTAVGNAQRISPQQSAFGAPSFAPQQQTGFLGGARPATTGFMGVQQPQQNNMFSQAGGFQATAGFQAPAPAMGSGFGLGGGASLGGGGGGLSLLGAQAQQQSPHKFVPLVVNEKSSNGQNLQMQIQHVAAKDGFSQEELRLNDYKTGNRGAVATGFGAALPVGGGFSAGGFAPAANPMQPVMGGFAAQQPQLGAPGLSGFGSAPAAATSPFGGGFGAAARPGAFGVATAAPTTTFGFGAPAAAPVAPTGSFFGNNATKVASPQTGFGSFSTAGFGAPAAAATSPFGQPAAAPPAFGATAFGAAPAPSAFGAVAPQPFGSVGGGFGGAGGFGAPGAFGAVKPAATGFPTSSFSLNKPATPAFPTTAFNAGSFSLGGFPAGAPAPGAVATQPAYASGPPERQPDDILEQIQRRVRERSKDTSERRVEIEEIDEAPSSGLANKVMPTYRYTPKTAARVQRAVTRSSAGPLLGSRVPQESPLSLLSPEHLMSRGKKIVISSQPSQPAQAMRPALEARPYEDDARLLAPMRDTPQRALGGPMSFAQHALGEAAPTLTKPGYVTKPPIEELRQRSAVELERVHNFEICHAFGTVRWQVADLRNVNLDNIVHIAEADIEVYPDDVDKPEEGYGLNRPATLTYLQFSCGDDDHLDGMCKAMDATLVSNDARKGVCVIAVKHFTKYSLRAKPPVHVAAADPLDAAILDGTEAEESMTLDDSRTSYSQLPFLGSDDAMANMAEASYDAENIDYNNSARDDDSPSLALHQFRSYSRLGAARHGHPAHSPALQQHLDDDVYIVHGMAGDDDAHSAFVPALPSLLPRSQRRAVADSACMEILKRVQQSKTGSKLFSTTQMTAALSKGPGVRDFSLAMGRSFRAGWGPNNQLVHVGMAVSADQGHVVSIVKVGSAAGAPAALSGPLEALLQCSTKAASPPDHAPLWKSPAIYGDRAEQLKRYNAFLSFLHQARAAYARQALSPEHHDWPASKAVDLVVAMCGQEQASIESLKKQVPLFERTEGVSPGLWECRREAVSNWLQEICLPAVPAAGRDDSVNQRLFNLLSSRQMVQAAELAERENLPRLATLLAQADGDSELTDLMRAQVQMWSCMGAAELVPPDLMRIYRLLGAEYTDDQGGSILKGCGWKRGLGMLYWFGCSNNFHDAEDGGRLLAALHNYQFLHIEGGGALVDAPTNAYKREDGLFALLRALLMGGDDSECLVAALQPGGYSGDCLDYRAPFLVLSMLECLEPRRGGGRALLDSSCAAACLVRQHFLSQLVSRGDWVWAIFVATRCPQQLQRTALVRTLVSAWVGDMARQSKSKAPGDVGYSWDPETDMADPASTCHFLVKRLDVKFAWICEAAAMRRKSAFDFRRCAELLCLAVAVDRTDKRLATRALKAIDAIVPTLHLSSPSTYRAVSSDLYACLRGAGGSSVYRDHLALVGDEEKFAAEEREANETGREHPQRDASLQRVLNDGAALRGKVERILQRPDMRNRPREDIVPLHAILTSR